MTTRKRRAPAWALLIAIVAALTLVPAGPAHALPIPGGCKEAPAVTIPSTNGPAWFGAHAALEATGADPFAPGATTSLYQEYGWPTVWWPTYDLGCGPDIARNPGAVVGSFVAEILALNTLVWATGFDSLVHAVLDWKGLDVVDQSLGEVVDDVRADVWLPLVTVVVLLTALWFLVKVIRGESGVAVKAAVVTLLGSLMLVVVINYPTKSAQVFDGFVKGAVAVSYSGAIPEADSSAEIADGIAARVFTATTYDRWCEGMVGGDRAAADKWCPQLWKSLYLSRHEQLNTKGSARRELIEKKQDRFEEIAEEIKDQDPSAYAVLTGRNYQTRMFSAGAANIIWPLIAVFPLASLAMLMISLMLMRVAVLLAPVFGPLMLHPAARRASRSGLHVLGAALLNAMLFGITSALFLRIEVAIMAATDMPIAVRLIALAVLMFAFLLITKPLLHLKRLRPRKAGESDEKKTQTTKVVAAVRATFQPDRAQTVNATTTAAPPPSAEAGTRP